MLHLTQGDFPYTVWSAINLKETMLVFINIMKKVKEIGRKILLSKSLYMLVKCIGVCSKFVPPLSCLRKGKSIKIFKTLKSFTTNCAISTKKSVFFWQLLFFLYRTYNCNHSSDLTFKNRVRNEDNRWQAA